MKTLIFFAFNILAFVGYAQTFIPDAAFEQTLIDLGLDSEPLDGMVKTASIDTLKKLAPITSVSNLSGIEDFSALEELNCSCPNLTSLNLSQNQNLKILDIENGSALASKLTNILLPNSIEYLDLSYNEKLTFSDFSSMLNLNTLIISNINLTQIDITKNIKLKHLKTWSNDLTSIDVSQHPSLEYLNISRCDISNLDLSKNTQLKYLFCSSNDLSMLDLSANTMLKTVSCDNNSIRVLDVSNQPQLKVLSCDRNDLTQLDLSKNDSMEHISCSSNNLTDIQFGNKQYINSLYFSNNLLTSIDLSTCTGLYHLYCDNNQLNNSGLILPSISNLSSFNCRNNLLTALDLTIMRNNWEEIDCSYNQLNCLKVNPHNDAETFYSIGNTNLNCIETANTSWTSGQNVEVHIDNQSYFSQSCPSCITSISELNAVDKKLIRVTDIMGRELQIQNHQSNQVLIYLYDDGTVEKVFQMSK